MKYLIGLLLTLWVCLAAAAEVVTLQDGRSVQLNDDFTWHYVPSDHVRSESDRSNLNEAAPQIARQRGSVVTPGSGKPSLQLSDSGVEVVLGSARYADGKLMMPTAITNQSSQSVITIEVQVEIFDDSGHSLQRQTVTIWQSIKRLAETYLRPGTAAAGKVIALDVAPAERYRIVASITQVESR